MSILATREHRTEGCTQGWGSEFPKYRKVDGHVRLLFRLSILCSITISVKTPTAAISQAKNQEKIQISGT